MRRNNFTLGLCVAILTLGLPAIALAQQPKIIELVKQDGSSKFATIFINDENLMFEVMGSSEVCIFTAEAIFIIDNKNKTYREYKYDELQTLINRKLGEITDNQNSPTVESSVGFRLTEETDTILGFKSRKLIEMSNSKLKAEIWVSSDLIPAKLRAVSERLRSMLPEDYWRKTLGIPGMPEIIMLYGIPVKIIVEGQEIFHAQVGKSPSSSPSFQVPSDYKKVKN